MELIATSQPAPRFAYWVKTLSKFVSLQLVVQAVGVASGILLVRILSQREYAFLTIAFAMQSTMNILADSGIGIGLSSIGGRVWRDPYRFGQLINTALRLRRYLAGAAIVVVAPILLWLLKSNGASPGYAGLLTLLVVLGLSLQLTTVVLMVVPRLTSEVGRVQRIDLLGALTRLALLCTAYFLFLNAAVATLASVASIAVQYALLRRWTPDKIDVDALPNKEDRAEMIGIIKNQAPNSIFFCLQGQLTVWLIAIFGNTQSIAEVGALSRLGVAFAVVGAVMTSIVLSGFARCQSPKRLRQLYFQIVGCFICFGASLLLLASIIPGGLLWVLGKHYSHLTNEVGLMVLLAVLTSIGVTMTSLNMTKGWVKYYWLNIPFLILLQAFLIHFLNLTTTSGVLIFGVLSVLPGILFSAAITWVNLLRRQVPTREE